MVTAQWNQQICSNTTAMTQNCSTSPFAACHQPSGASGRGTEVRQRRMPAAGRFTKRENNVIGLRA